jgi:hypothetical protein
MVPVGLEKRTNFFFVFLFWLYFSLSLFITCIYLLYVIYTSPAYLCVCVCQRDSPAAVVCVWLFYPGWAVWFVPCRRSHKKTTRGGGKRTVSRSIWLLGESGLVVDGSQVFHLFFFLFFFFLFLSPPHSATPYQLVIFLFGLSRSMGNCLFPLVFFFFFIYFYKRDCFNQ